MEQNLLYGYKYDEISKRYIQDKNQSKTVKNIFLLFNYGFYTFEIKEILNGKSIYNVISDKIFRLVINIQEYNSKLGNELVVNEDFKINVFEVLNEKKIVSELIINPLNNLKSNLKVIGLDGSISDMFLYDLDDVINIVNNIEEIEKIIKKYK